MSTVYRGCPGTRFASVLWNNWLAMLVVAGGVGIGRPLEYCSSVETSQSRVTDERNLLALHLGVVYCTASTRVWGIWKLDMLLAFPKLARMLFRTVFVSTPCCSDFCHV